MESLTTARKVGGSIIVTIPRELVEQEGIGENQLLAISVRKVRKSGFGMCKGLGKFGKDDAFGGQLE